MNSTESKTSDPLPASKKPAVVVTTKALVFNGIFFIVLALVTLAAVDYFHGSHHLRYLLGALIPSPRALLLGAALAIPFFILGEISWVLRAKLGLRGESTEDFISKDTSTTKLFVLSLSSGITEEVLFRGTIQALFGVWVANIIFGLSHCTGRRSIPYVVEAFLMGLVLSAIYIWSGSLWVGIVVHVINNFLSFHIAKRLRALFGVI